MGTKQRHYCILCGLDEEVNRKRPHHIMPRRYSKDNHYRVWTCRFCHIILHKAESMGLCKLPKSKEEFEKWKMEFVNETNGLKKDEVTEKIKCNDLQNNDDSQVGN